MNGLIVSESDERLNEVDVELMNYRSDTTTGICCETFLDEHRCSQRKLSSVSPSFAADQTAEKS